MASLERKVASLEANLAEERANHALTKGERDGFKEKSESLEKHLEAAFKDLKEAGEHLKFHHEEIEISDIAALSFVRIPDRNEMVPMMRPRSRGEWRAQQPTIVTVETPTSSAVLIAAFAGTFTGAAVLLFGLWLVIHYAL